jgi:hypothetical protein
MLLQPQNYPSDPPPSLAILRIVLLKLDPNPVRGFSLADASRCRRLDAGASACPKSGERLWLCRLGCLSENPSRSDSDTFDRSAIKGTICSPVN